MEGRNLILLGSVYFFPTNGSPTNELSDFPGDHFFCYVQYPCFRHLALATSLSIM